VVPAGAAEVGLVTGSLSTLDHVQRAAERSKDRTLQLALTVISVMLVATMAMKEMRSLLEEKDGRGR
jgi:hypothetical protein